MANKALIVIDVQEGLFGDHESEIYRSGALLDNINELIGKARRADIPIIFIRHDDPGLPHGSTAWQIHGNLEQAGGDIYVEKQRCDSFFETDLQDVLSERSIDQIFVCGLQTEYCIDTACRSAVGRNIKTILVEDAHSTRDSNVLDAKQIIDHHNEVLGLAFVELVSTEAAEF